MSEADKIIESLKNSGRKVEEFYTGNKTSDKNVASEEIMTKEAFDELIDNLEVVEKLTLYGRKAIKYHVKKMQQQIDEKDKKIKELEEETLLMSPYYVKQNYIPKRKVEDELETLRKMLKSTMEGKLQEYTVGEIIIKINTLEELLEGE